MGRIRDYLLRNGDTLWRKVIPRLNLLLVGVCIVGNCLTNAGFCRPVAWAAVLQGVCFLNIIFFTRVERTRLRGVNALLCGISTGVFTYWCLFLEAWLLLMPIPLWFLLLLVWRNFIHPVSVRLRVWYLAGMLLCMLFAVVCMMEYRSACKAYDEGRVPNANPMTERIAGMHFLYHTCICIYDGWRPPLHDPALVLGMRLNGRREPLQGMELKDRVKLYRSLYPDRPVVLPCACCLESAINGYSTDSLWE